MVCDDRPARCGQDHCHRQLRPAISAGRGIWQIGDRRCRRHPQLRLVVYRQCRADRHGGALYHAGIGCRCRQCGLARFPQPVEKAPHPPADQWGADCDFPVRPVFAGRGHPKGPCPLSAAASGGTAAETRGALSGLCAVHQGRHDCGLYRVFRRSGQRGARAGLGLYPALGQGPRRGFAGLQF